MKLNFNETAGINGLALTKVTAGWIVVRYTIHDGAHDVLSGAFQSVDEAASSARDILTAEVAEMAEKLKKVGE